MPQLDILTSLPTSLSCSILRDWLSLRSVIALDSAFCCKANRGCFHEILQSEEYFIREEFILNQIYSPLPTRLNGLPKIGHRIRSVVMKGGFSHEQGVWLARHCRNLTRLYYLGPRCCISDVWDIVCTSDRIELLELRVNCIEANLNGEHLSPMAMLLPNLKALAMSGYKNEQVIDILQKASNLVRLDLYGARIDSSTLLQIPPLCPHLTSVGLADTPLNDDLLARFTELCPQLHYLNIKYVGGVTDAGVQAVVKNLKALRGINIEENAHLTDRSLVHIYTHCANTLQVLHMSCTFYDGIGHMYRASETNMLLQRCTQLRVLNFEYLHEDKAFDPQITLPNSTLSNLTTLILGGNVVCERNLIAVGKNGTKLEILGIRQPSSYTWSSLIGIYEGCPKLKQLYFEFLSTQEDIDNANFFALARFTLLTLWAKSRPALLVGETVPVELQDFKLLSL